jgi:hypothetical protein
LHSVVPELRHHTGARNPALARLGLSDAGGFTALTWAARLAQPEIARNILDTLLLPLARPDDAETIHEALRIIGHQTECEETALHWLSGGLIPEGSHQDREAVIKVFTDVLDRLMAHPNPLVVAHALAIINCRTDTIPPRPPLSWTLYRDLPQAAVWFTERGAIIPEPPRW